MSKTIKDKLSDIIKGLELFNNRSLDDDTGQLYTELENLFDNLDCYDFFGTEGWKVYMGIEE